jgi:DNA-binding transcriptional MocR family regulator
VSIPAIAYAWTAPIRPSPAKFVFIALCNWVQSDGSAWSSVDTLAEMTSQNRKTVVNSLRNLEAQGWIKDTGRRVGATSRIVVYELRVPDAVILRIAQLERRSIHKKPQKRVDSNSPGSGRQQSRIRSANSTGSGSPNRVDPSVDPLHIHGGDKSPKRQPTPIGEHLDNLKAALGKRT